MTVDAPTSDLAAAVGGVDETAAVDVPPLPTRRDEAWRYAPHRELGRLRFGPPSDAVEVPADVVAQIPSIDGPRIVVVNGSVDMALTDIADLPDGLRFEPLASIDVPAAEADGHSAGDDDAFAVLHRLHHRDRAVIAVEADRQLEDPVHVVHVSVPDAAASGGAGDPQNATCTGAVIRLGAGSAATVFETYLGSGQGFGGSNARSSIDVGVGSNLTHFVLQDLPADQIQLCRVEVRQQASSEFHARCFNLGAAYGRVDYRVTLAGEGATADLAGLYFGFGDQTLDQQITVVHDAKDCTSRQSFRGVLDDRSTGVFNGGILVSPGADGTDAEQANDNLILSMQADVNTQPRLEILADDVACKHGATVGQLDEIALYYLRSRGIPAEEARQLLIAGFAEQTVDEIGFETVQSWIVERLGHGHA